LKLETSPSVAPRTIPDSVRTLGAAAAAELTTVFGVPGVGAGSCALAEVEETAAVSQSAMNNF
jgi:hypothetical protein